MRPRSLLLLAIPIALAGVILLLLPPSRRGRPPAASAPGSVRPVPAPTAGTAPGAVPEGAAEGRTLDRTGLVLDASDGAPVGGARVEAADRVATTDGRGAYRLELSAAGEVEVRAEAGGYVAGSVSVRLFPRIEGLPPIFLRPVAGRVSGRVLTFDGRPVEGANVSGFPTGPDGRFGPIPLAAGPARLVAIAPDLPSVVREIVVPPGPGPTMDVELVLPEADPVRGRVFGGEGEPIHGARIRDRIRFRPVTADADGRFVFPVARGDRVTLEISAEGFVTSTRAAAAGAEVEVHLAPRPAGSSPAEPEPVEDPFAGRLPVRIRAVDAGGRPVAGAELRVRGPAVHRTWYSDAAGAAVLLLPPEETVRIEASHPFTGRGGAF